MAASVSMLGWIAGEGSRSFRFQPIERRL